MTEQSAEICAAKIQKRPTAHNKKMATKTVEKGLLIVHTGAGKGKTSAALGMVVTGRNPPPALIEAADLVTEMTLVKQPFREQNVKAQTGMEF